MLSPDPSTSQRLGVLGVLVRAGHPEDTALDLLGAILRELDARDSPVGNDAQLRTFADRVPLWGEDGTARALPGVVAVDVIDRTATHPNHPVQFTDADLTVRYLIDPEGNAYRADLP